MIGDRVTQIDIDILYHCRLFKIPSVIVRSKADQHIRNMMQGDDWETSDEGGEDMRELCRAEYVATTRRNIAGELKKAGLPRQKVYIVSCVLAFREFCAVSPRSSKPPKEGIKKARNFIDEEELMRDLMILAAMKRSDHIIPSAERAEHQPAVLTPQTRPEAACGNLDQPLGSGIQNNPLRPGLTPNTAAQAESPILTGKSRATRQSAATPNSQSPMEEVGRARNCVDEEDPMLNLIPNAAARAISPVLTEKSCPTRQTVTTANSPSFLTDLFRCIDRDIPDIQGPPSHFSIFVYRYLLTPLLVLIISPPNLVPHVHTLLAALDLCSYTCSDRKWPKSPAPGHHIVSGSPAQVSKLLRQRPTDIGHVRVLIRNSTRKLKSYGWDVVYVQNQVPKGARIVDVVLAAGKAESWTDAPPRWRA